MSNVAPQGAMEVYAPLSAMTLIAQKRVYSSCTSLVY
jgi:hypothetical protein